MFLCILLRSLISPNHPLLALTASIILFHKPFKTYFLTVKTFLSATVVYMLCKASVKRSLESLKQDCLIKQVLIVLFTHRAFTSSQVLKKVILNHRFDY